MIFKKCLEGGGFSCSGFCTVISVRNTISEPVEIIDNHIKSTKENSLEHGYGLRNIETILNKYGASFVLSADDTWFSFCTVIPNE